MGVVSMEMGQANRPEVRWRRRGSGRGAAMGGGVKRGPWEAHTGFCFRKELVVSRAAGP